MSMNTKPATRNEGQGERGAHMRVLVDELRDAVGELLVELRQRLDLVHRRQHVLEERLVLLLQR